MAQKGTENVNCPISINKIGFVIKSLPTTETLAH